MTDQPYDDLRKWIEQELATGAYLLEHELSKDIGPRRRENLGRLKQVFLSLGRRTEEVVGRTEELARLSAEMAEGWAELAESWRRYTLLFKEIMAERGENGHMA